MKFPMILSIIIPAKNEEKYLPRLLKSIKKQDFNDYEIIVADAGSTDRTREIAAAYGCKISKGGLPGKGRNMGARAAKGDILLFLDADGVLPKDFLEKSLAEFKKKKLDAACTLGRPITRSSWIKALFAVGYNLPLVSSEKIYPHGSGAALIIKKEIFQKIKGYNEKLKLCEEHDLIKRAAKIGKYRVLRGVNILISLRRYRQDGWIRTISIYILSELHTMFIGPVETDVFNYKLGNYSKK